MPLRVEVKKPAFVSEQLLFRPARLSLIIIAIANEIPVLIFVNFFHTSSAESAIRMAGLFL